MVCLVRTSNGKHFKARKNGCQHLKWETFYKEWKARMEELSGQNIKREEILLFNAL